uniref:Germ cell-less protein-like 1-like n=1 Tax=Saccoglossus kowalevskii TaxID=10224 RepID=A0ABM0MIT7_SACKO|nr:PREDICTED: germ cell-less protein-like 1-like [Saccoglossus kowalevskii]
MGNYVSGWGKTEGTTTPRKRNRDECEPDSDNDSDPEFLHTPKRKKLHTTSKYIYETLFVSGQNSDVTIQALGKEWHLHKVYLCQSGYFSSMFSGSWMESSSSWITIDIPDDNIDIEALRVALGSLYRDDVMISPSKVVPILAAATLLQLDGLIQQCADIMTETTSKKTVCTYHAASSAYGLSLVANSCVQWLERNLMLLQSVTVLRELSIELMETIIKSANLFVLQVEMDVYTMVKKWTFLKITPSWQGTLKQLTADADSYFRSLEAGEFLESEREWLLPIYKHQWQAMLAVEIGTDRGPAEISLDKLGEHGMRCGRIINKEGDKSLFTWQSMNLKPSKQDQNSEYQNSEMECHGKLMVLQYGYPICRPDQRIKGNTIWVSLYQSRSGKVRRFRLDDISKQMVCE